MSLLHLAGAPGRPALNVSCLSLGAFPGREKRPTASAGLPDGIFRPLH
ncbi:hypothetical protein Ga0080574_TMP4197 [Salipiger abyssi]|uniref:Uncharacterized protein n=1 Tax=Salipiger abyssi TaxID=1250539 RepID=A0A1P8UYR5_9RHOB|nr:hypothetical protein Ga0080574_TMP4197 [Salipiger abyssi]